MTLLNIGADFAGYRVLDILGSGGMGAVYLVENAQLHRCEALKVISVGGSNSAEFERRFVNEARAAAGLDHPGIVTVHHYGVAEGTPFFTMAFLAGQDLSAAVLNAHDIGAVVASVADALDYAHGRGVIHRDIKPANVIVRRDDSGRISRVVVVDFGIARLVDVPGATTSGAFIGTLAYAAPEVLDGGEASPRSDQYSLACTTYELLCGRAPFSEPTPAALMLAHITKPAPKASAVLGTGYVGVDAVLERALAKDPAHRFSTVTDFARALTRALEASSAQSAETLPGEVITHAAQLTDTPAPRSTAKIVVGIVTGVAIVAVLGVVAATLWWRSDSESAHAASAAAPDTTSATTSVAARANGHCSPETTTMTLVASKPAFRVGDRMMFAWRIRNDADTPCPLDIGVSATEIVVTSAAGERQWGSRDCSPEKGTRVVVIAPHQYAPAVGYKWSLKTSELTCTQPRQDLVPGTYRAVASVDGIDAEPVTFTIR
ncbi:MULTISPECIES: serine/threonine-protein kinase [unclassified Gordonia (in: high G+C Gram-positive bacteria)]|uniref:serine/threonine-protein kinase n=1 Tax=unclassified Gordonia (in: high G+C Gram-positive bacteria) TaxID=2657482 RepID=UPI001F0ED840|nr:serine/threonine-protein kinase [Gordonia sp. ABSL49_1]MCH5642321.1 serine/threonine protein kinase [Gordonia sp. ABSL49_1]